MSKKSLGGTSIYVILGLIFIAIIGIRTISTPEIWTHLAQGQNNAPISFLASDNVVNTTWLYDKLAYMMWNIGGPSLLIILNVIGLITAFALLLQVAKKWGGPISQGFALLISGHLIFQTLDVGPAVIMMLFIGLFLFLLQNIKSQAVLFGALIPLQIIWTNMHESFLYGPIIAALTMAQVAQNSKGAKSRKNNQAIQSGTYGILAAALLVATVLNPYFFKLHGQVFANIASPAPAYWSSLFVEYFQIPALKPLILFTMVLGAAGLITLKKKLPVVLTSIAIYAAFLVWTSPRNAMLFAAMALPFMVLSFTSVSDYLHQTLSGMLGKNDKVLIPATGGILIFLFIASIIPIVSSQAYVKTGSASVFGLGIQDNQFPNDCEALFSHPDFPAAEKTINLAADGGYIAFNYGRKCFIDYRSGRYDKEMLKNFSNMMQGNRKSYDELYLEYHPEAIIINTLGRAAAQGAVTLLRQKGVWKLAYFDGTTLVLLRNREQYAALLNDTEIQKAGLAKLEAARAAYAAKPKGNPAELIGSGKIYLALNRPEEAKAVFSLLLQGNKFIPGAWIGLGTSQMLLKEFDDALVSLKVATEMSPNSIQAWASYALACKYSGLDDECKAAQEKLEKLIEQNKANGETEETPEEEEAVKKEPSLDNMTVPE